MARSERMTVLIIIALGAVLLAIYFANYVIGTIQDNTAKATVVAAIITGLGVIFSAMFNEISSYYKDRSINIGKKWELVYPLIKKHYYPWINSAKVFHRALQKTINEEAVSVTNQTRLLYLITVFYGYRLKFIIEDGGIILLSSNEEEEKVDRTYRQVENALQWDGDETPLRVSYLQKLFISKNKPENPYVLEVFSEDLSKDPFLEQMRDTLGQWLNKKNMQNADEALQNFITTFKLSIDKLYSAWET